MRALIVVTIAVSLLACNKKEGGGGESPQLELDSPADIQAMIAKQSKEMYGVAFEVTCPEVSADNATTCEGTFEGAKILIDYSVGHWETKRGVIVTKGLQGQLEKMAEAQGASLKGIDCGPAKIYGAQPGRTIECKLGERVLTIQVKPDGNGILIAGDSGGQPQPAQTDAGAAD